MKTIIIKVDGKISIRIIREVLENDTLKIEVLGEEVLTFEKAKILGYNLLKLSNVE